MVVLLSVHPSRQKDLRSEHKIEMSPRVITRDGLDPFGNIWTRFVAPPGRIEIRSNFLLEDSGRPDESAPDARQWNVSELPDEVLPFLYGSRYCDTQRPVKLQSKRPEERKEIMESSLVRRDQFSISACGI